MASMIFEEGTEGRPYHVFKKQLMPNIVDGMARIKPLAIYAEQPNSPTDYSQGYRTITYGDFANAINGLAWWIHERMGPGKDFPTLVYLGPFDFRYNAFILASVKAGYKTLLTSPRNSQAAHLNLFKLLDCNTLITTSPHLPAVKTITTGQNMTVYEIPSCEELLDTRYPHYSYPKTFAQARSDPLVILHTSGSTGLPKPMMLTHDYATAFVQWSSLDPPEGYQTAFRHFTGNRLICCLPPFHAGGIFCSLISSVLMQTTMIYMLSGVPTSGALVCETLKHVKVDGAILAPPFVGEIGNSEELTNLAAKHMKTLLYGGGDIPAVLGEKLSKRFPMFFSGLGSTEAGFLPAILSANEGPGEDWHDYNFHPDANIDFRHRYDDLYEAVIVRYEDPEREQPCFKIFPELKEWATKDLFSRHPTKPYLWQYRGRNDDIIVFLTGEKTNPTSMEQHVGGHPLVRSALVVGAKRFQAALLIELQSKEKLSTKQKADMIETLWPIIQEANEECPQHAKVAKSHIMFADPEKPFERAGKGTVQRALTLKIYSKEIDQLYNDADKMSSSMLSGDSSHVHKNVDVTDKNAVKAFVRETIESVTNTKDFKDDEDFYVKGMDSLQTLQLTRTLKQVLAIPDLDISNIYTNPTVEQLTNAIMGLAGKHEENTKSNSEYRREYLEKTLKEYEGLVDEIAASKPATNGTNGVNGVNGSDKKTVILTGSTGGIGSYMLDHMLKNPKVAHIYCINRAADSHLLQAERSGARGLSTDFPADRVSFVQADLSKPHLGLDDETYNKLANSTTDIIHNAWPVNFNLSLATFRPHLNGLINLISLAATKPHHPASFLFISSVSSAAATKHIPIPEIELTDVLSSMPMGYGESKYLSERILCHAAKVLKNEHIGIARVGQVSGPVLGNGVWNKHEWLPSLVTSSLHLGIVPESLGGEETTEVDWVPIDILANVLLDLLFNGIAQGGEAEAKFYHPVNPVNTSWRDVLMPIVVEGLNKVAPQHGKEKVVTKPFGEWVKALRREADGVKEISEEVLAVNPGIKLVGFYEGLGASGSGFTPMSCEKAVEASDVLKEVKGVKGEWMKKWVEGWVGSA